MLTAISAQLDQQEELQAVRKEWFELVQERFGVQPTISGAARFYPWSKPEDQERFWSALSKAGLEGYRSTHDTPESIVLSGGGSHEDHWDAMTAQAQLHCTQYDRDAKLIPDDVPDGIVTFACVDR